MGKMELQKRRDTDIDEYMDSSEFTAFLDAHDDAVLPRIVGRGRLTSLL